MGLAGCAAAGCAVCPKAFGMVVRVGRTGAAAAWGMALTAAGDGPAVLPNVFALVSTPGSYIGLAAGAGFPSSVFSPLHSPGC
jgi:hypothetical protein